MRYDRDLEKGDGVRLCILFVAGSFLFVVPRVVGRMDRADQAGIKELHRKDVRRRSAETTQ